MHVPFLSEHALKFFKASFNFSAVTPCSHPSTFNVDLFLDFNILYYIIIVNAIKHILENALLYILQSIKKRLTKDMV